MGVYIKGMEMPKDGVYWCEIGVADDIAMITIHGEDRKSFHLVPIPEPHGDLIDRHEAYLRFGKLAETLEERNGYEAGAPYAMAAMFLNNANEFTTVIPAEEGE